MVSAPGPDGFNGSFYQVAWEVVRHDIVNDVRFYFVAGFLPAGLNSNIVTLILKSVGASRIEKFRPIVLGNFIFKIFSKILATRIWLLLHALLSLAQYNFIPRKQIHHCITACSEGFQCLNKG